MKEGYTLCFLIAYFLEVQLPRTPSCPSVSWLVCLSKYPKRGGRYSSMLLSKHCVISGVKLILFIAFIIFGKHNYSQKATKQNERYNWNWTYRLNELKDINIQPPLNPEVKFFPHLFKETSPELIIPLFCPLFSS